MPLEGFSNKFTFKKQQQFSDPNVSFLTWRELIIDNPCGTLYVAAQIDSLVKINLLIVS